MTGLAVLSRRGYALLAAAVAAFVVYGSLVPFHFQARPLDEALGTFRWVLQTRVGVESRSDVLANCLLGVPLGFCLMGALRADRGGTRGSLVAAAFAWPACVGLAVGVEFAQVFIPGRTPSGNDVLAQGLGAAAGVAAWLVAGPRLTGFARRALADPRGGGAVGRLLAGYLLFVAVVQLLPLDLSVSPGRAYRRVRDGDVTLAPFGELSGTTGAPGSDPWSKVQNWLELAGLFLPAGLVAARLPGRAWRTWAGLPAVAAAGLAAGLVTEAGQLLVSRHPSTTDALFASVGVTAGWAAARAVRPVTVEAALVHGQLWLAVLAVAGWQPFDFGGPGGHGVNWLPFADAVSGEYLGALDALLRRTALFVPFGVLVVATGYRPPIAALVGVVAAAVVEAGQVFLPSRYPSTTDLVLAAIGAAIGATVTQRTRITGRTA